MSDLSHYVISASDFQPANPYALMVSNPEPVLTLRPDGTLAHFNTDLDAWPAAWIPLGVLLRTLTDRAPCGHLVSERADPADDTSCTICALHRGQAYEQRRAEAAEAQVSALEASAAGVRSLLFRSMLAVSQLYLTQRNHGGIEQHDTSRLLDTLKRHLGVDKE